MKTGYLSYSGKKWRVIYQGLPICNDKDTRTEAEAAAAQCNLNLDVEFWDGDNGTYSITQG